MTDAIVVRRIRDPAELTAAPQLFDEPLRDGAVVDFLAADRHHLLYAYRDAEPVGMISGVVLTHPDKGREMFLYELGVAEEHRRRGIATSLIAGLAEVAQEQGCYGMWVLTELDNEAALAAYRSAGGTRDADSAMVSWVFDDR